MSTRRAVRPDSQVYRLTRRLGGKRRRPASIAAWVCLAAIAVGVIIFWWISHRH